MNTVRKNDLNLMSYKTLKVVDGSFEFFYLLDESGFLHSDSDLPSLIVNDYKSGILYTSYFFSHGLLYRPEVFGPSIISESGHYQVYHSKKELLAKKVLVSEDYLKDHLNARRIIQSQGIENILNSPKHRLFGPAMISSNLDDISRTHYIQNGLLHRTDGPAILVFKEDYLIDESWFIEGESLSEPRW